MRQFADGQLKKGNTRIALKEYQRILFFDNRDAHQDLYMSIAGIYDEAQEYDNAIRYYDMAWNAMERDSIRNELIFKKTVCYFRQERFFMALSELYGMPDSLSGYHSEKRAIYLGICYFGLSDFESSLESLSEILDSAGVREVKTEFARFREYQRKYDPDRLEIMSIFLPGLGQLYGGQPASAANSFLLLAATACYSFYTALHYSILDGVLFFTSWFYRYYTGGHKKAYEIGIRLQEQERNKTYRHLMQIVSAQRKFQ